MSQPQKERHYLAYMSRRLVKQSFYPDREIVLLSTTEIYSRGLQRNTTTPTGDWTFVGYKAEDPDAGVPNNSPDIIHLSLVMQDPHTTRIPHWGLFAYRPWAEDKRGRIWQVMGVPRESLRLQIQDSVSIVRSRSLKAMITVNTDFQPSRQTVLERIAHKIPPPDASRSTPGWKGVYNCQGWVIRVLERLVAEGIVSRGVPELLMERLTPRS